MIFSLAVMYNGGKIAFLRSSMCPGASVGDALWHELRLIRPTLMYASADTLGLLHRNLHLRFRHWVSQQGSVAAWLINNYAFESLKSVVKSGFSKSSPDPMNAVLGIKSFRDAMFGGMHPPFLALPHRK